MEQIMANELLKNPETLILGGLILFGSLWGLLGMAHIPKEKDACQICGASWKRDGQTCTFGHKRVDSNRISTLKIYLEEAENIFSQFPDDKEKQEKWLDVICRIRCEINDLEATGQLPDPERPSINRWPHSQSCVGCIHGQLIEVDKESSVYLCKEGHTADGLPCPWYKD
jgi:hypothetical protein